VKEQDALVAAVPTIGLRKFVKVRADKNHDSRLRKRFGQEMVLIKAEDLEAGWSMCSDYRPPDLSRNKARGIEQFEKFLAENEVIETAHVQVKTDGRISLRDGRHRTRVLLNLGMEAIPVTMTSECLQIFERYYDAASN